jgi:hypothetical protein
MSKYYKWMKIVHQYSQEPPPSPAFQWTLNWDPITYTEDRGAQIIIGSCPRSAADIQRLKQEIGIDAIVSLQVYFREDSVHFGEHSVHFRERSVNFREHSVHLREHVAAEARSRGALLTLCRSVGFVVRECVLPRFARHFRGILTRLTCGQ